MTKTILHSARWPFRRSFNITKNTVFSAFAARKSLEQAVKWMYSVDGDLHKPYDDSIQTLVHEPTFVNAVPSNIRHDLLIY
ncbi:MAG: hypothetical protein IJ828_04390 [Treponema sp.]|nr:hypothetical protein [Treponema sp.]